MARAVHDMLPEVVYVSLWHGTRKRMEPVLDEKGGDVYETVLGAYGHPYQHRKMRHVADEPWVLRQTYMSKADALRHRPHRGRFDNGDAVHEIHEYRLGERVL